MTVPITEPDLPDKLTPPITHAAMASAHIPYHVGFPEVIREAINTP